jgi:quercetin dioxygenase-like cupin family protein
MTKIPAKFIRRRYDFKSIDMTLQKKNFNKPDETMTPPYSKVERITINDMTIVKYTFQPGWQWSKHVKPSAGTDTCQFHHFGVQISGTIRVRSDDGQEMDYGPGDVMDIPPGHDGWVIGKEPAIFYGFFPQVEM